MPRNAEVIRQWTILRAIERARAAGVTIDDLAATCHVTTRTIRRDLQALEEAGFPICDSRDHEDGRTRWSLNGQAFKALGTGLTLAELCALYFSRSLLESLAGTPFREDLETAFEKVAGTLTPHMRRFLDQLPRMIATKAEPVRQFDDPRRQLLVARALEAALYQRQATLTYYSKASERTKTYRVHPYRLAYAAGALYLLAYVPEYGEIRTFALERLQDIALLEERFTTVEELPDTAFPDSLGVHSGPPERIAILFDADVADYVQSVRWHLSQQFEPASEGRVVLRLNVCVDHALRRFILSFGRFARVLEPASLAADVSQELAQAYGRYESRASA